MKSSRVVTVVAWLVCVAFVIFLCQPFYFRFVQRGLNNAVSRGAALDVERMLWLGADVNGRATNSSGPDAFHSPINEAVFCNHADIVRVLLAHGAHTNINMPGDTALVCAARNGNVAIVRLLLDHGADIKGMDTALNSALTAGAAYPDVVKALVERGAPVNTANNMGETPLIRASQSNNVEGVRLLVSHGANVNTQNMDGYTALMSVVNSCPQIDTPPRRVRPLRPIAKADSLKQSRQDHARFEKILVITRLLLDDGADPNIRDRNGYNQLLGVHYQSAELAKLLRQRGAKE